MFGPDVCHEWLDANGLQLLVRSHEMKEVSIVTRAPCLANARSGGG